MSGIKKVTPEEAVELMERGYVYIDVRSEPEFEQGHPPGSLNVPLMHFGPGGLTPNNEFMQVIESAFGKEEKLLLGCRAGKLSRHAAQLMAAAGYSDLADLTTGWEFARDPFGRVMPGWIKKGLPVETGKPAGQAYADVKNRKPAIS